MSTRTPNVSSPKGKGKSRVSLKEKNKRAQDDAFKVEIEGAMPSIERLEDFYKIVEERIRPNERSVNEIRYVISTASKWGTFLASMALPSESKEILWKVGYFLWFKVENVALTATAESPPRTNQTIFKLVDANLAARKANNAYNEWKSVPTVDQETLNIQKLREINVRRKRNEDDINLQRKRKLSTPTPRSTVMPLLALRTVAPPPQSRRPAETKLEDAVFQKFLNDTSAPLFAEGLDLHDIVKTDLRIGAISCISVYEKFNESSNAAFDNFVYLNGLLKLPVKAILDKRQTFIRETITGGANLPYVNTGTYNSVWKVPNGTPNMPAQIGNQSNLIVRVSLIDKAMTYDKIVEEVVNMVEAAQAGYGMQLYGAKIFSAPPDVRMGNSKDFYYLVSFFREGRDLFVRLKYSAFEQQNPHYFGQLHVAIFRYSKAGFIFVDAKLNNFIDTYARGQAGGSVFAADLDAEFFRRLWPKKNISGHAWKILWAFNVLVVSTFMKIHVSEERFLAFYKPVQNAVASVLEDMNMMDDTDESSQLATSWVTLMRFKGHKEQLSGIRDVSGVPSTPTTLAALAVDFAVYYQIRMQVTQANEMVQNLSSGIQSGNLSDQHLQRLYQKFVDNELTASRFFEYNLNGGNKLLTDVMIEYCNTPVANLRDEFITGQKNGFKRPLPYAQFVQTQGFALKDSVLKNMFNGPICGKW